MTVTLTPDLRRVFFYRVTEFPPNSTRFEGGLVFFVGETTVELIVGSLECDVVCRVELPKYGQRTPHEQLIVSDEEKLMGEKRGM